MKLIEVRDKRTAKRFLEVAAIVYRNDEVYVRPLDISIETIFNPAKNDFFSHGEATRWILEDDKGNLIGRVAAFINKKKAFNFDQPTGGMGFFECIEDQEAANLLFETCRKWLEERGMQAMDGPINFGENDNFWGLLVEGFTHPSYGMNYNPPYYRKFFEDYGFAFYYEQVSNHLDMTKPFPERFWKIAEWVNNKKEFTFRHFTWKDADKFLLDLKTIYDDAWQFHENFTPIKIEDLRASLMEAKSIIIEEMIWFVYAENNPIAFLVMFPDANEILKHFNGKMNLWNKLRFVYYKKFQGFSRTRITIMGVAPKYQRSGVESGIFWQLDSVMKKHSNIHEVELSWVGDFNPKMRQLHEAVGGTFAKRHITYRKLFTTGKEAHRSTIIPVDTREQALRGGDQNTANL